MDLTLTPEQELIRRSAREFVDREITPHVRDWDRAETMDRLFSSDRYCVSLLTASAMRGKTSPKYGLFR
jgi:alkylation response protein AidB-like acyl-CoA dehydrogenase